MADGGVIVPLRQAQPCAICGAPVYTVDGEWYDEHTGQWHNGNCRGYSVSIPLIGAHGEISAYALVDTADADWVNQWTWRPFQGRYAHRWGGKKDERTILMHRALLGLKRGDKREVDHINHDGFDNRRSNLRIVTSSENHQNQRRGRGVSRFVGVSWCATTHLWRATVTVGGKQVVSEYFVLEEDAARVARAARAVLLPFSRERRLIESELNDMREELYQRSITGKPADDHVSRTLRKWIGRLERLLAERESSSNARGRSG